jgi:hypothetical protein
MASYRTPANPSFGNQVLRHGMRVAIESSNPFDGNNSHGGESEAAFEQHFTPQEIADLWKRDPGTIRRMFRYEEGVIVDGPEHRSDGKRDYVTLRIPGSVVKRVHDRLMNKRVGRLRIGNRRTPGDSTGELQQDAACLGTPTPDDESSDAAWEREVQLTVEKLKALIHRDKTEAI